MLQQPYRPANTMPESPVPIEPAPARPLMPAMDASDEWAAVYTIMIRNIPNKYTQQLMLDELNAKGFFGTYDFLYLPIDPDTNANRGYAFINFISPGFAYMFKTHFDGKKFVESN